VGVKKQEAEGLLLSYFDVFLSLLVMKKSRALVINKATVKIICHAIELPS